MDIFGFDDDNQENNDFIKATENKILIDTAIKRYKNSVTSLLVIFGIIIIILNILIVPYFFNERLEARIEEIEMNTARSRNLPDNYSMVGVEVGMNSISSVIEIECSSGSATSSGSGLILNEEGYIITNSHVVTYERGGFFTSVTDVHSSILGYFYKDNTSYSLEVVNYDSSLDLAILKFSETPLNLEPITVGNSNNLNMGEELVAIGNAQGLGLALTVGVVSDPLKTFSDNTTAIQTDAAINPGNSGGALFNIYSEFVGVTTFKIIDTNANEGMGFAIPSNVVIDFIQDTDSDIDYTLSEEYYN